MKTLHFTTLLLLSTLVFSSCFTDGSVICTRAQGEQNLVEYKAEDFNKVELQMDADVVVTQGESFKIEVEAANNIHDILEANVSNNELTLSTQRGKCIRGNSDVVFYITCPSVEAITLAGSGSITNTNALSGENLDINLTGSGSIDLEQLDYNDVYTAISGSGQVNMDNLESNTLETKITGSGDLAFKNTVIEALDLTISGSGSLTINGANANDLRANITGSGKLKAENLPTDNVYIKIGGSGAAYVDVLEELEVNISGSGDVHYTGQPNINTNITGSGKLVNEN